jgi:parallel beta-helix repeat protein
MVTKKKLLAYICTGLIAISMIFPAAVRAANAYYVSSTGNDSNPGTLAQPFRTLQKGASKLVAGDTLNIRGGTYAEIMNIGSSGSAASPITIASYPGETAIIDGGGTLPSGIYNPLVNVGGTYIVLDGLEIRNSAGRGISLEGSHNTVQNCNVHNIQMEGIYSSGSYSTIQNNKIWRASDVNYTHPGGDWPGAMSFGAAFSPNTSPNITIRNNEIYQNSGEGILCMYTDNGLIEGNIVRDNWAEDIYLDQCSNTTIRGNLVYYTQDKQFWRNSNAPKDGIAIANEAIQAYPIAHDIKIYNNIVVNTGNAITFWTGFAAGASAKNATIANNTIINNFTYGSGINIGAPASGASHQNTVIENNIISVGGTPLVSPSMTGLTYTRNLWSKKPSVLGSGDMVGNPLLSDPAHSVNASIDPRWYTLTSSSPAKGKALVLSDVQTDYFGIGRDSSPDIGANEYTVTAITGEHTFYLPMIRSIH